MTNENTGMPMVIDSQNEKKRDRLVIATDFGTTFSCVAFASNKGDIRIVKGYPSDPMTLQRNPRPDVPTESWYPNKAKLKELATENTPNPDDPVLKFDDDDEDDDDYYVDEQNPPNHDSMDIDPPRTTPKIMYWGYEVQDRLSDPDLDRSQYNRITRSKLLLDTSVETMKVREELKPILKKLKSKKYINSNEDVIEQYLEQLFVHAKRYLNGIRRLKDTTCVEHVLCVLANSNSIFPGEAFILLDAGGGTVDATTYTVDNVYPLKLKREEVAARGGLYGSSYLNEAFREYLLGRLESEKSDIEINGKTIEGIVDQQTIKFENVMKRTMDVTNEQMTSIAIRIDGIRESQEKSFIENRVVISR